MTKNQSYSWMLDAYYQHLMKESKLKKKAKKRAKKN